jgi:hypothetical protein
MTPFFLVILVTDSEYNHFPGTQPIPGHSASYLVSPGALVCTEAGEANFSFTLSRQRKYKKKTRKENR